MAAKTQKKPLVPTVMRGDVKQMVLHRVKSSQIHSAGYDPQMQTLAMRFKSDWNETVSDEYRYADFPPDQWKAFEDAASKGIFHKQRIRDNPRYPCVRICDALAQA